MDCGGRSSSATPPCRAPSRSCAGALAQHAEETLEAIGHERLPIVRELFRNLVTARML
jgi:hypothetical protein